MWKSPGGVGDSPQSWCWFSLNLNPLTRDQHWEFALLLFALSLIRSSLFALLLIRSLLFCSISLILKSNHEQFAHIALYKRVTMNNSLMSLFKKEPCEVLLVIRANHLQKRSNLLKKSYFLYVFDSFSPFYAQKRIAPVAPVTLYKRVTMSDSLRSPMTKERPWAIR